MPLGDNSYHVTGYREASIKGGGTVKAVWFGRVTPAPSLQAYRLSYEWLSFDWQWGLQKSTLAKKLRIRCEEVEQPRIVEVQREDLPEILKVYHWSIERLAKRLNRPVDSFPLETSESLGELLGEEDSKMVGIKEEGRFVGFALATIESEPDDLLHPLYGDILYLLVRPDRYGLGYESFLYQQVLRWFQEREIRWVRSTVYPADPVQKAFWRSLGFKLVAERIERPITTFGDDKEKEL